MRPLRALLAVVVLASAPGCATVTVRDYFRERQWTRAPGLPAARLDVEASELSVHSADTLYAPSYRGEAMRTEIAGVLDSVLRGGPESPAGRFRLRADVRREKLWITWFPCLVVLVMFGCPISSEVASVELDVDVAGVRWSAQAEATIWQGAYYNGDAVRAALARATGAAVQQLKPFSARPP
jgi:hypothetical protein